MAALPYMTWHPADYMADTLHLTTLEHGAYCLLLFNYWMTGKPLRSDRLHILAKLSTDEWTDVEPTLAEFFEIKNGKWVHVRVEDDLKAAYVKVAKASKAGNASALARKARKNGASKKPKEKTPPPETPTDVSTDVETDDGTPAQPSANPKIKLNKIKLNKISDAPTRAVAAMESDWEPSAETLRYLVFDNSVGDDFVDEYLPRFVTFWVDNGKQRSEWDSVFMEQCLDQWQQKVGFQGQAETGEPTFTMFSEWMPMEEDLGSLMNRNIPNGAIWPQVVVFRNHFIDNRPEEAFTQADWIKGVIEFIASQFEGSEDGED